MDHSLERSSPLAGSQEWPQKVVRLFFGGEYPGDTGNSLYFLLLKIQRRTNKGLTLAEFSATLELENMRKIILKNVVWKEGKYYVAQCLNVDVSSFGKTKKEALSNLDEALELYFEDVKAPKIIKVEKPELVGLSLQHA